MSVNVAKYSLVFYRRFGFVREYYPITEHMFHKGGCRLGKKWVIFDLGNGKVLKNTAIVKDTPVKMKKASQK